MFEQRILDKSGFTVDSESGYSQMKEIEEYDVYYRCTGEYYNYIWNDNKYSFHLTSNQKATTEEIKLIIQGIK